MRFGLPTSRACRLTMLLIASLAALVSGCSLDRLVDVSPPTQLLDPALYKSVAGAHTLYNTAVADFAMAYAGDGSGESMVPLSGLLSDELQMSVFSQQVSNVDARFLNDPLDEGQFAYNGAQTARIFATIAATFLRQYAPGLPQSLAGRMYAYEGYEEVMLAEVFCSGIPVSTVDFQGDFEYGSGLTTSQLLTQALALFDSAAALAKDSTPILDLARVGRARALLDLAQYQDAANAVSAVPTAFIFPVLFFPAVPGTGNTFGSTVGFEVIVADREGGNGLDWVSAHDTARVPIDPNSQRQLKYRDGAAPVTLADGIEARLIEAEAQLPAHGGGGTAWLDALNALRTDGTFTTQQDPNDPTVTDTLWHSGDGRQRRPRSPGGSRHTEGPSGSALSRARVLDVRHRPSGGGPAASHSSIRARRQSGLSDGTVSAQPLRRGLLWRRRRRAARSGGARTQPELPRVRQPRRMSLPS